MAAGREWEVLKRPREAAAPAPALRNANRPPTPTASERRLCLHM